MLVDSPQELTLIEDQVDFLLALDEESRDLRARINEALEGLSDLKYLIIAKEKTIV